MENFEWDGTCASKYDVTDHGLCILKECDDDGNPFVVFSFNTGWSGCMQHFLDIVGKKQKEGSTEPAILTSAESQRLGMGVLAYDIKVDALEGGGDMENEDEDEEDEEDMDVDEDENEDEEKHEGTEDDKKMVKEIAEEKNTVKKDKGKKLSSNDMKVEGDSGKKDDKKMVKKEQQNVKMEPVEEKNTTAKGKRKRGSSSKDMNLKIEEDSKVPVVPAPVTTGNARPVQGSSSRKNANKRKNPPESASSETRKTKARKA